MESDDIMLPSPPPSAFSFLRPPRNLASQFKLTTQSALPDHPTVADLPRVLSLPVELLTSTIYDSNLSTGSDGIRSSCGSPFPGDNNSLSDHSQQYLYLCNDCEFSAGTASFPALCNVSNPSSSADCSAGNMLISVPTSILPSNNTSSSSISAVCDKDVVKTENDEAGHYGTKPQELPLPGVRHGEKDSRTQCLDAGFRLKNPPLHPGTPYSHLYMPYRRQQQSTWNIYPMYYP
ncbi:hypothetical protein ACKAV7_014701 [Fusarium commune]